MNEEDSLKAQVKLIEARDRCNWTITHLEPDEPYSDSDIAELREAKECIMLVHDKLDSPYPPPPDPIAKTAYPLFDVNYMAGYAPWDLHAMNLPYNAHFDSYDWVEGAKHMAKNHVNATRFFLATGEGEGDLENYFLPFKRKTGGRFDLTEFGDGMTEIEWRLERFWERDIHTVICIASGIKGARFRHTVWHKRNNIHGTTDDHRYFMTDAPTVSIYKNVLTNLWERWKDKPVIFEFINEPGHDTVVKFNWYNRMMAFCESIGIPSHRFAFEKWDSSKILDLLDTYDCWCYEHAVNHINWFRRFHRGEMQDIFNKYTYVAADSDGARESEGNWSLLGEGLIGKGWNPKFKRPAPVHMESGLKYDKPRNGGGWMIMSAGGWYKNPFHFEDWRHAAVDGLTKSECNEQNVDWSLFSYRKLLKRYPLGELKAIQKAMKKLFG